MLQAVERERETLKQSMGEMCENQGAHRTSMSQVSRVRRRGCASAWTSREVSVDDTIHDKMFGLWQKGAGNGQLRDGV